MNSIRAGGWRFVNRTPSRSASHRTERDSFFVFFTEDPVWLRPLLGAVNLGLRCGDVALVAIEERQRQSDFDAGNRTSGGASRNPK